MVGSHVWSLCKELVQTAHWPQLARHCMDQCRVIERNLLHIKCCITFNSHSFSVEILLFAV